MSLPADASLSPDWADRRASDSRADAVEALMQNVYPPNFAVPLGYQSDVFAVCAAAARHIPVFRLSRPWDLAAIDRCIDVLERHLGNIS